MDAARYLQEWMKKYFENRDLFLRTLKGIKETEQGLVVTYKDKTLVFLIMPTLDIERFKKIVTDPKTHCGIACYNTAENLDTLITNWTFLAEFPLLSLYFINPFSEGDNKWIIRPKVHDRVTEKASLKTGLQSLFEGVPETTIKHVEHMAKKS